VDYNKDGNAILPLLSELIKNFSKAKAKTPEFQPLPRFKPTSNPVTSKKPMDQLVNPPPPKSWTPNHKNDFQEITASGGATENYAPVTDPVTPAAAAANPYEYEPINPAAAATDKPSNSGRSRRNSGTYKDSPANIRKFPIEVESYDSAFNIISDWEHPVLVVANRGQVSKKFHSQQKMNKGFLAKCYLLRETWFEDPTCLTTFQTILH
jgi:hypothetical protein